MYLLLRDPGFESRFLVSVFHSNYRFQFVDGLKFCIQERSQFFSLDKSENKLLMKTKIQGDAQYCRNLFPKNFDIIWHFRRN